MKPALIIGALCIAAAISASLHAHEHFRVVGVIIKLGQTEMDIKNKEGKTYTVDLNKKTVVKREKEKAELGLSALKVGQTVVVDAYGDDEFDLEALDVRIVPPIGKERQMLTRAVAVAATIAAFVVAVLPDTLHGHGVSGRDAWFLQFIDGPAIGPFMYLGAKHMVTGYDHLLFLVGVIFFLYRLKDVVLYVSLFTLGHSLTLLLGVLGRIHADAYLIDAIIGLSIVYKAFENMGGFDRLLGFTPNTRAAVMTFGLFHGFGLATKLQDFSISENGLVTNIVSFNVGVEIGQALALTAVLIAISYWRLRPGFLEHAFATNTALMTGGFILTGFQLVGYFRQ